MTDLRKLRRRVEEIRLHRNEHVIRFNEAGRPEHFCEEYGCGDVADLLAYADAATGLLRDMLANEACSCHTYNPCPRCVITLEEARQLCGPDETGEG